MHGRAMRQALNAKDGKGDKQVKYWSHGYWRDVWLLSKAIAGMAEKIAVLKTLRMTHDFKDRNYDRHCKDALASERLSKSPNVVDIYAYCSNSAIFEYGDAGDIDLKIWPCDKKAKKHYKYEYKEENKMIDIYSMGNIFYAIVSGNMPFKNNKEEDAQKKIKNGEQPIIPDYVLRSDDIALKTIVSAVEPCWKHDPKERPSASTIRDELMHVMDKMTSNDGNATNHSKLRH
ncbi:hypothetical protein ACHAW6_002680 [Cyclotella cf. meneghiniana]